MIISTITLVLACASQNEDKDRGTMGEEIVGANYTHGNGPSDSKANEPVTKSWVDEGKKSDSDTDSRARISSTISEILFSV